MQAMHRSPDLPPLTPTSSMFDRISAVSQRLQGISTELQVRALSDKGSAWQ
jgi:hypothetical protein